MGVQRRPAPTADQYSDDEETTISRRPAQDDEAPAPRRARRSAQPEPEDAAKVYLESELEAMSLRQLKRAATAAGVEEVADDEDALIDAILDAQEAAGQIAIIPATRASKPDDDDDDDDLAEDEDEDEVAPRSSLVQAGWGAAKKLKNASGGFASEFRFDDEQQLVKFLSDEPFASYQQHWVERAGKKSFMCLGKGCPLCRVGDDPSPKTAFNIAVIVDGEAQVQALICGPKLLGQLETLHKDKRSGPLDRHFFAVSRSGKKGSVNYNFSPVKERDLADDWDLDADDVADLLSGVEPYDGSVFKPTPKPELVQIAREYAGEDD